VRDFISFDTWVNGKKSQFVEVRDFFKDDSVRPVGGYCHMDKPSETRWMTKRLSFAGKAITTIRVQYEALYQNHHWQSGQYWDSGYYHVSVGRYWKDKIKKATFVADFYDINESILGEYCYASRVPLNKLVHVTQVLQWEPSLMSYKPIFGSFEAANWRSPSSLFHWRNHENKMRSWCPRTCAGHNFNKK
jgi:hypothetical protein